MGKTCVLLTGCHSMIILLVGSQAKMEMEYSSVVERDGSEGEGSGQS